MSACVIIPTYAPSATTERLVRDIVKWNPKVHVYVVDDSTPPEMKESALTLFRIARIRGSVTLLRTPSNQLKAGALNYALAFLAGSAAGEYEAVLTADDDVVIAHDTIPNLLRELKSRESLGAVCSQSGVINKNANVLTRLQGLEYLGFNAVRLADEGFFRGPLVMHGMLTAFRYRALKEVGGFCDRHLIEDYEITARLKDRGWIVSSVPSAKARTVVPETLSRLWRQRTRWSYGGLTVVAHARHPSSVIQDLVGHAIFLLTVMMVLLLVFSNGFGSVPSYITSLIIGISLAQLAMWYLYQVWLMSLYREKDAYDWFLRLTLLPELLYSYVMTAALIGSYSFFVFNFLKHELAPRLGATGLLFGEWGDRIFVAGGYSDNKWGTKPSRI